MFVSVVDLFRLASLALTLADKADGSNSFHIQMFRIDFTPNLAVTYLSTDQETKTANNCLITFGL